MGAGVLTLCRGAPRRPVSGSSDMTEISLLFWPPQSSHFPEGLILKCRGISTPQGACWRRVSWPVSGARE